MAPLAGAVGTLAWSSPEQLLGQRCSFPADVWSLGIILWEIATGEAPRRGQRRELTAEEAPPEGAGRCRHAVTMLLCGVPPRWHGLLLRCVRPSSCHLPSAHPTAAVNALIDDCLRGEPAQRPTAEQVVARLESLV